jgi:LmbE family N-acetylglucosaminyl deacetylase
MRRWKYFALVAGLMATIGRPAVAQGRGAARLQELVRGITVTARVLTIGAHPDDDDPDLIAWLARGHMVETGYLSLTRGEAGQNYLSADVGAFLGAVRTEESIAARNIDGGRQFYTRAYDFGFARNADEAFKHWPRDSVLGDMVAVIRSFRPQVLIVAFNDSISDGNGQHDAASLLVRDAFAAAADTAHFPATYYGAPWQPLKLYRHGGPLRIDADVFDPVRGKSYADLAVESRGQHRSQGLIGGAIRPSHIVLLDRVAMRTAAGVFADASSTAEQSIFDGVDTSFARLVPGPSDPNASTIRGIGSYADSARRALDLAHPGDVVGFLANAARLADSAREDIEWCGHPAAVTLRPSRERRRCDAVTLDRDASIDLIRQRIDDALLIAAGVDIQATADRELIATDDTVPVTITLRNHGKIPVTLGDVSVNGVFSAPTKSVVVAPDSIGRAYAAVSELPDSRPWWFGKGPHDLFGALDVSADGLMRAPTIPSGATVPGVAMPENLRRVSDATVSVTIDGVRVTTSVGPIIFHYASPLIGMQDRPVSGAPAVTLSFARGLEWIVSHKRVDRPERLSIESFSDQPQSFALHVVTPAGLRVDSAPAKINLAPHERREIFLQLRGVLDSGRAAFGARGNASERLFIEGFQTVEYPHVPPIRVFRSSGFWLQTVDVAVPSKLLVAYIPGPGDDMVRALRDVGVGVTSLTAEDLPSVDLSVFTTIVIGPRAFDADPELLAQRNRFTDFARKGGTVVVLQQESPALAAPYPLGLKFPRERVASPDAPVTVLDSKARLLNWPNVIRPADWAGWSTERAAFLPTSADAHYTSFVEMHDAKQPSNRNALLMAPVGKGVFVYTALSLQQQITLGVPGGLRLLVNLISAGLSGELRR